MAKLNIFKSTRPIIFSTRPIIFSFLLLLVTAGVTTAQQTMEGTWKAKVKQDSEKIHISFHRDSDNDGHNHMGHSVKFSEIDGLNRSQVTGSKTNVSFRLNREPGNILLTGSFENGKGSGDYTFTPNQNFLDEMKSIGFENISTRKLFSAAVLNVRAQTAREIKSAGLKGLDFEDVFKATIFKIDANYFREMNNAGFKRLDMEDLVKARIFKIDSAYAKNVNAMGFGDNSIEQLVKFKIFKVTPDFIADMKTVGLDDLDVEDMVQLRIFKINSQFVKDARAKGYKNPSVGKLVELKIFGKVK